MKHAANSLLSEGNKTKFFQKYRAVSQELEKCLDDLLLISDAISSLEDGEGDESAESEEDDKPPDDCSLPVSNKGMGSIWRVLHMQTKIFCIRLLLCCIWLF